MKLILNIGLDVKATSQIAAHVALEIVKACGLLVGKHKVVQSDTEPTLVVEASTDPTVLAPFHALTHQIAADLQQDCIAVFIPNTDSAKSVGLLSGPRAAAWGEFNPEFFFLIDGSRLAAQKVAA